MDETKIVNPGNGKGNKMDNTTQKGVATAAGIAVGVGAAYASSQFGTDDDIPEVEAKEVVAEEVEEPVEVVELTEEYEPTEEYVPEAHAAADVDVTIVEGVPEEPEIHEEPVEPVEPIEPPIAIDEPDEPEVPPIAIDEPEPEIDPNDIECVYAGPGGWDEPDIYDPESDLIDPEGAHIYPEDEDFDYSE